MKSRRLGKSAIAVSPICMGTMTFGSGADEAMSHRILDASLDAGINFFDTAENYPGLRTRNGPASPRRSSAAG
jgi:aryl-alcohol dehydrogenase-like predicted oxidoreductase